jgi:NifB/MoaA-like Fe-S oxidoreductase
VPPAQLQAHAKELANLAGSLPAGVDRVNQGLLPKDTGEKLKRIEELSKRLKNELGY